MSLPWYVIWTSFRYSIRITTAAHNMHRAQGRVEISMLSWCYAITHVNCWATHAQSGGTFVRMSAHAQAQLEAWPISWGYHMVAIRIRSGVQTSCEQQVIEGRVRYEDDLDSRETRTRCRAESGVILRSTQMSHAMNILEAFMEWYKYRHKN